MYKRQVLGKLKGGQYNWSASTTFNGKKYQKQGVFVVDAVSQEQLNTRANHALLNQIAENSGGKFYNLKDGEKIISDLNNRNDIVNVTYEESTFNDFIDYKWLFFLLIIFLGLEWFLRRRAGSY